MDRRRWRIVGAIGLTVLALVVLASGLSSLNFHAGQPLPRLELFRAETAPGVSERASTGFEAVIQVFVSVVFWVLLPVSILYMILSAEARRRLWRNLVTIGSVLLFVYLIVRMLQVLDLHSLENIGPAGEPGAGTGAARSVEPPDFIDQPPDWIMVLVSGAIFAVIGLLAWRMWQRLRAAQTDDGALEDELAREAESALDAIRAGQDLSNVVLRCYRDMERAVQRAHNLHRRASMTPREFERRLVQAGLDADAVGGLTRLFERVRYGDQAIDDRDEVDAEAYLRAIAGHAETGASA